MTSVIIGVDPHTLSATIEVVDGHEKLLGSIMDHRRHHAEDVCVLR